MRALQPFKADKSAIGDFLNAVSRVPKAPVSPAPISKVVRTPFGAPPIEKGINVSTSSQPLPTYHNGTGYVPATGPANLEKGEAVIPKEANPYAKVLEMGKEKKPKKLREIRTRRSKNGGYIHEHHYSSGHDIEEHTSTDKKTMQEHMGKHLGEESTESGAEAQDEALGFTSEKDEK